MPKNKGKKRGKTKNHAAPRFIQNADELAMRDDEFAAQSEARRNRRLEAGCDDEDLLNADDGEGGFLGAVADMARMKMDQEGGQEEAAGQQAKKKQSWAPIETANPNAKKKSSEKPISTKELAKGNFQKKKLTRREREEFEKQAAERRYWKKIEDGTHKQAKKDLARLEEVKKRRAEAAKKKLADVEATKAANEAAKQAAKSLQAEQPDEVDDEKAAILKLSKLEIKKMKPAVIKDKLKELGLPIQGNKKTLIDRLLKACGH
eukprot:g8446.t1